MSSVPVRPPLDCSLLFHELVNFHMDHNPTLPMFVYADDQAPDHHTTEITFLEFGRAAHRVAHALSPRRTDSEQQVVMLIANCDTILYHAAIVGISIAGLVPFLVSHRNSAPAVVDMMNKTNCSRIITLHHAHSTLIASIHKELSGRELVVDELPAFSYAFPKLGREVEADPFELYMVSPLRPDLDSPSIYFHSSGSTGFPKPIAHTHKLQMSSCSQPVMQSFRDLAVSTRLGVMGLPPFHGYGTGIQLYLPLVHLVVSAVYAPRAVDDPYAGPIVPTTENMLDSVRWTGCKAVVTVPTFLEQWALSQESVEELKKLEFILYGGGPLSDKVGDNLCAAGVAVTTCYGGTEFGCPTFLRTKEDILQDGDWNWMRFSNDVNIRWVPYGDGTYECQILSSANHPLAVENLPDTKGYATSDLWIKHPTKDLWKTVGRTDDVIILASGEKTVPAPMKGLVISSPFVEGAVMFGRERNQVGIIVEPRAEHVVDIRDDNAVAEFRNKIWPLVDEANKTAPAFSRIFKEMILITTPKKPISRTPKGSIQKKATVQAYQAEIDALYNAVDTASQLNGFAGPSVWTTAVLKDWLLELASSISGGNSINPSTDLFSQGFDSLSVTYLRNKLVTALRTSPDSKARSAISHISSNIIFENPTIELLAARITIIVDEDGASRNPDLEQNHVAAINAMIEKYSSGLLEPPVSVQDTLQSGTDPTCSVVLLTGFTGGLGSFLLAQLIESPRVEKIYTLNRPSSTSSEKRQHSAFIDKGLPVDLLKSDKLICIEADASQDRCGLSLTAYEELQRAVTMIIHNAWRLDFNLSLASFEPNVRATRNLVDLGLDSAHRNSLRFVFTSSVGSAQSWDHEQGAYPEEVQLNPSPAVGSGYGEAKYVCERIAGGPNGSWATTDWVPILVKSGIALGAFPGSRGVVSWMHAEDVASSVLDVAFAEDAPQALNIVNPRRPLWAQVISSIRDAVLEQKPASLTTDQLPIVPFMDWVVQLEKKAENATPEDFVNIASPAIKCLEFFRGMARHEETSRGEISVGETGGIVEFSTAKAQHVSKTIVQMKAIGEADAHAWVKYWSSVGLF